VLQQASTVLSAKHPLTPTLQLALARALWDSSGDKARARTLAERARDGFARLGAGREPDHQNAMTWLANHVP
jgi:hypothetical protein